MTVYSKRIGSLGARDSMIDTNKRILESMAFETHLYYLENETRTQNIS